MSATKEKPLVEIENLQQLRCCACESAIPAENCAANLDANDQKLRTVKCKCEHCKARYRVSQRRRGDWWYVVAVEPITDQKEIKALDAKLDILKGNKQLNAA